jgi:hypothetical protein
MSTTSGISGGLPRINYPPKDGRAFPIPRSYIP